VIREIREVRSGRKFLADELLFDFVDVVRCTAGRFIFSFRDREPVELQPGETLVIYPGHYVSIKALEADNALVYGFFTGADVVPFFDSLDCFDLMHGKTAAHLHALAALKQQVASATYQTSEGRQLARAFLADIIVTLREEMRASGHPLVFDAVRLIRQGSGQKGGVRVEAICQTLGVSRVHLRRLFDAAGLGSPSEFIQAEQLRLVRRLLTDRSLSIADVAEHAGFCSATHFSSFVKRLTGMSPRAFRQSLIDK